MKSGNDDAICCVPPPLRDPPPGSRYCRFAYSVGVVHFRKYCYSGKIGSPGNRRPVIRFRFYKPGCNCIWLKL
ncbi:hypothetical protein F6A45_24535 [Salmonella enterica]|nr:hypothetical protein [Salmonella enterica]ECX4264253.1 hypothetical protein [Salmonella enterica]EEC0912626.1 hypothetical protein [Salmonella enterica subsp. enterica serovar Abaetetuba]